MDYSALSCERNGTAVVCVAVGSVVDRHPRTSDNDSQPRKAPIENQYNGLHRQQKNHYHER